MDVVIKPRHTGICGQSSAKKTTDQKDGGQDGAEAAGESLRHACGASATPSSGLLSAGFEAVRKSKGVNVPKRWDVERSIL